MSEIVTLCRFPRCRTSIRKWQLMCGQHWRMVPKPIQRRVFATLTVYKERGTEASHAQYLHAVDDAVQAVQCALEKRKVASNAQ